MSHAAAAVVREDRHAPRRLPGAPAQPGGVQARVLALQGQVGNRAVAQLLRQTSAPGARTLSRQAVDAPARPRVTSTSAGRNDHELVVHMDNGQRYRVTRRVTGRNVHDPGRSRVDICTDQRRVFLRVAWCRGTRGRIDVGADPQGALSDLLQTIGNQISSGRGAGDVIRAVEQQPLRPFAEVDIARSGSWRVSGDVRVEVNVSGVQSVSTGVNLDFGWIRLRGSGGVSDIQGPRGGDPSGNVMIEIPFPWERSRSDPCPRQEVELIWEYSCERAWDAVEQYQEPQPLQHLHDEKRIPLYFRYASDQLRADRSVQAQRNADNLEQVRGLLSGNYRLVNAIGRTSPEGLRQVPANWTSDFPGNDVLSQQRVAEAVRQVQGQASPLRMRPVVDPDAHIAGESELFGDPPTPADPEPTGRDLERQVVRDFQNAPHEMAQLPAADQRFIRDQRRSVHARAQRIYPWLRRVDLVLRHDWTVQPPPIQRERNVTRHEATACPPEVMDAADGVWGPRDPRRRRDPAPSICRNP